MSKKKRKQQLEELWNPHILTLDQALALFVENSPDPATVRQSAAKAVTALRDRVTCRFTGPSNIGRLNFGERLVWDLLYMEGEVLNGGFHQYLTNSTGETGEDVKIYLQSIGASQTLELLRRLSKIFPGGKIPRDREERIALVEAAEDQATGKDIFNECSRCFYQQSEHVDALIVKYAREHRLEFLEPSDEVVAKLKRKDRISAHYCGSVEPEWVAKAEEALKMAEEFAATNPMEDWNAETKADLKALALAGKKTEAIRIYKDLFMCSLAEAKAAIARMIDSKEKS